MPYKDRQKKLEYCKAYGAKHYKNYYAKNRKRLQEKRRKYSADPINHQKQLKNLKRWKTANRERVRMHDKNKKYRRRSLLKDAGSHTLEQWNALKKKFNYCCADCGMQEPFVGQYYTWLTEDHVLPVSKNGSNNIENIEPRCFNCNSKKSDRV